MKKVYLLLIVLIGGVALIYYSCRTGGENLKIALSFQYHHELGVEYFISKYANKIVVSVYGNNFTPIKSSLNLPASLEWVCLSDAGYYKPDSGGFYEGDIYIPPSCDYPDRQLAKVVVAVNVPVGTHRSVVVETLNKDGVVTFRGSKDSLTIEDDTYVDIALRPIAKISFDVNELTDIKASKYEPANAGRLTAYYFERGEKLGGDTHNQATILGEQDVSSDKKTTLEFAYSANIEEKRKYLYPTLFGYYKGDNGAISFVMPGLAEYIGYGLEPGGSYNMTIFAALRDKIKGNPLLTAVTPSQINYSYTNSQWDWENVYLSYIHGFPQRSVSIIRAIVKVDVLEEPVIFSSKPEGGEQPFPNEVYDIGSLVGVEDDFYMGFRNISILTMYKDIEQFSKSSGDITVSMEFETSDSKRYKTNEIKIKYNIDKRYQEVDAGFSLDTNN